MGRAGRAQRVVASMGPCLFGDGNEKDVPVAHRGVLASMGPSLIGDGNAPLEPMAAMVTQLQWGRP